ncbi:hypothetical protein, partial [Coxiella burnetii]
VPRSSRGTTMPKLEWLVGRFIA